MVELDILPVIGSMPVKEVTKKDVSTVIGKVIDRGAKVKANRVLSVMKTIFTYAVEHGEIDESPVTMTRRGAGGREKPKNRVLTLPEISQFWSVLSAHEGVMSWRTKLVLLLILLTAQRPGEVAAMEWAHVDLDARVWTIPSEFTKAGREHIVHLSDQALEVLRFAHRQTEGNRLVFASARKKGKRACCGASAATSHRTRWRRVWCAWASRRSP